MYIYNWYKTIGHLKFDVRVPHHNSVYGGYLSLYTTVTLGQVDRFKFPELPLLYHPLPD